MSVLKNTKMRRARIRRKLALSNKRSLPRLSVFRSGRHIYAQLIDDGKGCTIVSASSVEKRKDNKDLGANKEKASEVGKLIAEKALSKGVSEVIFDRGDYQYHGRVKSLADSAREAGLKF